MPHERRIAAPGDFHSAARLPQAEQTKLRSACQPNLATMLTDQRASVSMGSDSYLLMKCLLMDFLGRALASIENPLSQERRIT
jgi:hypothetical protein